MKYTNGPANRKKILTLYLKTKGAGGTGRNAFESKFVFAEVKHEIISESRVTKSAHGQMMHREQYTEFAKTLAGGGVNLIEAEAQWAHWLADGTFELKDKVGGFFSCTVGV